MAIELSDIWVHVVGALVAAVVVDLYRSLMNRRRTKESAGAQSLTSSASDTLHAAQRQAVEKKRSCLLSFIYWSVRFLTRLFCKFALALLVAAIVGIAFGDGIHWADGSLQGNLSNKSTALAALTFVVAWMFIPIRIFKR